VGAEFDRRVARLRPGDHVCILCEGAAAKPAALAPFFRAGLRRGARCLLLGTREDLAALERVLEASGSPVGGDEERGALVVLESLPPASSAVRSPASSQEPGQLLDLLRQAEQEALDDGFTGLVVAGELVAASGGDGCRGSNGLVRCEALLGRFLAGSRTLGLCLYDRARLSPEALAGLLRTHPVAAVDGDLCPNVFAEPSGLVLDAAAPEARTSWMLGEMRRASEAERRQGELAGRLVEQQGALDRADRARDDFLAMLAHELRNPLGTISNAIQVLRMRGYGDETFARAVDTAERQVRRQATMVDDLLDASRVTRGTIELRREPLDLVALVREVAGEHRSAFARARLRLALELPEERLAVRGDRLRLAQALSNLLDNAVKYTPQDGRVTVRARAVDGRAEVTFRDTGTGIAADVLPHVFEVFAQGDHSLDRSKGGLGVGLAVVKGLVELHGGEVVAESAGPGLGAEFTLRLPAEPDPAARAIALDRRPKGVPAAAAAVSRPPEPRRILVVEDNPDAAESLRDFLELSGHEVELASSGLDGVEAARQFHPEIVLCDLGLPGMDGFEVAAELRRDPTTASARLIAVTGYGREEDRRRSKAAGFDLHLTKPVDPAWLRQLLQSPARSH
jgi:signal transduction histidine kinase/CheY-like chemotaxis protein